MSAHVRLGFVALPQRVRWYQELADAAAASFGLEPERTRATEKRVLVTYRDQEFWTEAIRTYQVVVQCGGERYRASREWSPEVARGGGFVGKMKLEELPPRGCLAALFPYSTGAIED